MKSLLSIQLVEKPEQISFQTVLEQQIKQHYPEITTFSLDNFSEVSMINYAQEFIIQAEKILILIESPEKDVQLNKLTKLMNKLVRGRHTDVTLVLSGENVMIEKMASVLGENFYHQPAEYELMNLAEKLFT